MCGDALCKPHITGILENRNDNPRIQTWLYKVLNPNMNLAYSYNLAGSFAWGGVKLKT